MCNGNMKSMYSNASKRSSTDFVDDWGAKYNSGGYEDGTITTDNASLMTIEELPKDVMYLHIGN